MNDEQLEMLNKQMDVDAKLTTIRRKAENPDIYLPKDAKRDTLWLLDYVKELHGRLFELATRHTNLKYEKALKMLAEHDSCNCLRGIRTA